MSKTVTIRWLPKPAAHNYPAALSYLLLLRDDRTARSLVRRLKRASVITFKANRALSPLLLVRDATTGRVIVADGYHRLCAVYSYDEDALIPCQIV